MIIVPKSVSADQGFLAKLQLQVERYLMERTAGVITFPDKIRVVGPVYLELTVTANLVVTDPELIIPVEKEAVKNIPLPTPAANMDSASA